MRFHGHSRPGSAGIGQITVARPFRGRVTTARTDPLKAPFRKALTHLIRPDSPKFALDIVSVVPQIATLCKNRTQPHLPAGIAGQQRCPGRTACRINILASYADVDECHVQKQLGHASPQMTRTYQRRRDRFQVNLTKAAGL